MQITPKEIFLITGVTDLRLGINGYAHIVQDQYGRSPMDGSLYIFCNRAHNKLKMLYWDGTGFWLLYKRLEHGTFKWIRKEGQIIITEQQFRWLMEGLSIEQKRAFPEVNAQYV